MFQDLTWKVEFYLSKMSRFLIFVSLRRFSKERRNALLNNRNAESIFFIVVVG